MSALAANRPRIARFHVGYGGTAGIVGTPRPPLTWTVEEAEGWQQQAYALQAGAQTVEVDSGESVFVSWPFEPLRSRERRLVRVRARSVDGRETPWSDGFRVEAALLDASDWRASFVGPVQDAAPESDEPSPFLRREFLIDRPVDSARLYVTALGVCEPYLNGSVVGRQVLMPNWTSYHSRLRYEVFDVGAELRHGPNVLGAILGDGWYRGRLWSVVGTQRNVYGYRVALLAQLEIAYADGTRQVVGTDMRWRTSTGPILASSIFDGERYDARLELNNWAEPGYDATGWEPVETVGHPLRTLVVPTDPPIRRIEGVNPVEVLESPTGKLIVDFGQNLAGRLRITVDGKEGETVTMRHAEVLEGGELALQPLRTAKAEDSYTLRGGGPETWEPRFTFHGFRFAQIDGWPGHFDPASVTAIVLHTDFERTGWFQCSNALVNRLHENAVWGMRGNFLGLPTDCPQRDERLGWTGDAQVFAPAASFLYDVNGLIASWLADLASDQSADGGVPHIVPDIFPSSPPSGLEEGMVRDAIGTSAAAWGDAAVVVPWVLFERFGDAHVLAAQWDSIRKWVNYVAQRAGSDHVWDTGFQFGDWLEPSAPPDAPNDGQTPRALIATAYFARSAGLAARIAEILGHGNEARRYRALAGEVRAAFCATFLDGKPLSATGLALTLAFSLAVTDEQRRGAGVQLSEVVAANDYRVSTGFIGTPVVCDALCDAGDVAGAYRLLLQEECPSWLYQVTMGATTIWERWDALLPDGRINVPETTSFNHYAYGAIVDWLHRTVAGLVPAAPGYRRIRFAPHPGGDLTEASARHLTPYGPAAISWRRTEDRFDVEVEVPPNTMAEIALPDGSSQSDVPPGSHRWSVLLHTPKNGLLTNLERIAVKARASAKRS
jgi:alpha-L-rhamnosidase